MTIESTGIGCCGCALLFGCPHVTQCIAKSKRALQIRQINEQRKLVDAKALMQAHWQHRVTDCGVTNL